jgi:hypothetical protein
MLGCKGCAVQADGLSVLVLFWRGDYADDVPLTRNRNTGGAVQTKYEGTCRDLEGGLGKYGTMM